MSALRCTKTSAPFAVAEQFALKCSILFFCFVFFFFTLFIFCKVQKVQGSGEEFGKKSGKKIDGAELAVKLRTV